MLRDVTGRRTNKLLGPLAAGKLLARKLADPVPISDSHTSNAFSRPAPDLEVRWWLPCDPQRLLCGWKRTARRCRNTLAGR